MNTNVFSTKHPIVCLPMNSVSDLKLAIAVAKAGCLPSLFLDNFGSVDNLVQGLEHFQKTIGNCNLLLTLTEPMFTQNKLEIIKTILRFNVSFIEILQLSCGASVYKISEFLQQKGIKVGVRLSVINQSLKHIYGQMDYVIVKGNKAAGAVADGTHKLENLLIEMRECFPTLPLIGAGGLASKEDINTTLLLCDAVGLGTIFAMSKESCVSDKTKNLLLSDKPTITTIDRSDVTGHMNGVVFSEDDKIGTKLIRGIRGEGGHIFVGDALKSINTVLSVQEIVDKLAER